jgi:hypothetical protein
VRMFPRIGMERRGRQFGRLNLPEISVSTERVYGCSSRFPWLDSQLEVKEYRYLHFSGWIMATRKVHYSSFKHTYSMS